ncbi:MAG: GNAT family N-acetyltransferase [Spirochaetales bacterium]|nr:GNAT family N-acetyltransferase [Spirochaetales bacterium]
MSKIYPPVLETERLVLRPLTSEDLDAIFKWAGDPRVNKYMIYPLWKSTKDGVDWINSMYEDEKNVDYGFVYKETGELIGSGGIYYHEDIDTWRIGYNLAHDYWKKGLAFEAISKIIEYVCGKFDVHVIDGEFCVDNYGSRRVMEKLGMSFYEDCEYTKLDGSETFKAKMYRKVLKG